jgi:hypothetical protein
VPSVPLFFDKPLSFHAERLPKDVTWYADPEAAQEIVELRCAGLTVRKGINKRRPGIHAVRARLENGTLRVCQGACPNLFAEAGLYRYDPESDSEEPIKAHDHALDALRYLVSRLDQGKVGLWKRWLRRKDEEPVEPPERPAPPRRKWLSIYNEALWTPVRTIYRS